MARGQDDRSRDPVRTTIVGGQPKVRTKSSLPIPEGIEKLIGRAASDARFRHRLLADREAAARKVGVRLTDSERMVLRSIPDEQLAAIINAAPPAVRPARRGFLRAALGGVGAWLAALIGGSAATVAGCGRPRRTAPPEALEHVSPAGERPDIPPPKDDKEEEETDEPPPVTRGIQPDVPLPKDE